MLDTEDILLELAGFDGLSDGENSVDQFFNSWDAYDFGPDQPDDNMAWPSSQGMDHSTLMMIDNTKVEEEVAAVKECAICLQELTKAATIIECDHEFCESCLKHWSTKCTSCPLCRRPYNSYLLQNGKTRKVKMKRPQSTASENSEDDSEDVDVIVIRRPVTRRRQTVNRCTVCNDRMNMRQAMECELCFNKVHARCTSTRISETLGCFVCYSCGEAGNNDN